MDSSVRQAVWERCKGYCEFCGKPLDPDWWDFHHRQLGTKLDLVENGVASHSFCHVVMPASIHQNPKVAMERGFIISKYVDRDVFSSVPLLLGGGENESRGRWVTLSDTGIYVPFLVDITVTKR